MKISRSGWLRGPAPGQGRYVFLEINTVSFFDFVERSAGLPISGAVADLLLGRSAPRVEAVR